MDGTGVWQLPISCLSCHVPHEGQAAGNLHVDGACHCCSPGEGAGDALQGAGAEDYQYRGAAAA